MTERKVFISTFRGPFRRRMAKWFGRRMYDVCPEFPLVSFTFDDFPRSAVACAGAILREQGFAGTYYVSIGLMGLSTPTGQMFEVEDLLQISRQGHELGCHTFDHCDSWDTSPAEFEASIVRNQEALAHICPVSMFGSLSYPINCPRPQTKRRVAKYFGCARGGGQTFNSGPTDLNYLNAFFLEQCREDLKAIKQVIDANHRQKGWLIFATHDVCGAPTRFGCTPGFFEQVVRYARQSGTTVLPVQQAWRRIQSRSPSQPA